MIVTDQQRRQPSDMCSQQIYTIYYYLEDEGDNVLWDEDGGMKGWMRRGVETLSRGASLYH